MSYDVSIKCPTCDNDVVDENHTSNTSIMWKNAGCDLATFDGKLASELLEALSPAITDMVNRIDHYRQFDAENGWGDTGSTLRFLRSIEKGCRAVPGGVVRVHR